MPLLIAAVAACLLLAAPAAAQLPQQSGLVDLAANFDNRIEAGEIITTTTGALGDFDADGHGDTYVLVEGTLHVLRGGAGGVSFADRIPIFLDASAGAAWPAGDVNGDGIADIAIGDPGFPPSKGRIWVVFGRPGAAPIDVSGPGPWGGFVIDGVDNSYDSIGASAVAVGDLDGDGKAELAVGAAGDGDDIGTVLVVFGKSDQEPVDYTDPGFGGYYIYGVQDQSQFGSVLAAPGDVNGDGRPDLAVGAPLYSSDAGTQIGATWVVFTPQAPEAGDEIDLTAMSADEGIKVVGPPLQDFAYAGNALAPAGDADGDGRMDVAVGVPNVAEGSGQVAIVYGRETGGTISLSAAQLEANDVHLVGESQSGARLGSSLAGAGDYDGDGDADLVAAAPDWDGAGREDSGRVFVIDPPSAPGASAVEDDAVLTVDGPRGYDAGESEAAQVGDHRGVGLGDVNGDGRPDVLATVRYSHTSSDVVADGGLYVLFGYGVPAFDFPSTVTALPVSPSGIRRTGPATFTLSPGRAGISVDPSTGTLSGSAATCGPTSHTLRMGDLAGSAERTFTLDPPCPADTTAPAITGAKLRKRRVKRPKRVVVRFTLSETARVAATLRCAKKSKRKRCRRARTAQLQPGANRLRIKTRRLRRGRYRLTLLAVDPADNRSTPVRLKLRLR